MRLGNVRYVFMADWADLDYSDIYGSEAFLFSNNEAMLTFWQSRDALEAKDLTVW